MSASENQDQQQTQVDETAITFEMGLSEIGFIAAASGLKIPERGALRVLLAIPQIDIDNLDLVRAIGESLCLRGLARINDDTIEFSPLVETLATQLGAAATMVKLTISIDGEQQATLRLLEGPDLRLALFATSSTSYGIVPALADVPLEDVIVNYIVGAAQHQQFGLLAVVCYQVSASQPEVTVADSKHFVISGPSGAVTPEAVRATLREE